MGVSYSNPQMTRVGQNRIYTPYMTVYLAIFLPKIPFIQRIYIYIYIYIWCWPTLHITCMRWLEPCIDGIHIQSTVL